jgi:hypothetical protein
MWGRRCGEGWDTTSETSRVWPLGTEVARLLRAAPHPAHLPAAGTGLGMVWHPLPATTGRLPGRGP